MLVSSQLNNQLNSGMLHRIGKITSQSATYQHILRHQTSVEHTFYQPAYLMELYELTEEKCDAANYENIVKY